MRAQGIIVGVSTVLRFGHRARLIPMELEAGFFAQIE